ncbi:MAG: hypothetical protein R3C01_06275 [Planctomycetaceae bacterium]
MDETLPGMTVEMPDGSIAKTDADGRPWQRRMFRNAIESGYFWPGKSTNGGKKVLDLSVGVPNRFVDQHLFDPRMMGLLPEPVWKLRRRYLDQPLYDQPFEFQQPIDDVLDGVACRIWRGLRIDEFGRTQEITYFCMPHQNDEVRRIRLTITSAEPTPTQYVRLVEARLKEWQPGIWFPEELVITEHRDERLLYRETTTISKAEFNIVIPVEEFTAAGLELPIDWPVSIHATTPEQSVAGLWDGKKVVPDEFQLKAAAIVAGTQPKEEMFDPPAAISPIRLFWLSLNVVLLFVVVAYGLSPKLRKKRRQPPAE